MTLLTQTSSSLLPLRIGLNKAKRQVVWLILYLMACLDCWFQLEKKVEEALEDDKLEAIVCVAGGWAGGNAASPGQNQYSCRARTMRMEVFFQI